MTAPGSLPLMSAVAAAADSPRYNFHALPWGGQVPIRSPELRAAYDRLIASEHTSIDLSYGRDLLDSPFWPTGPLAAAQSRAATAFSCDATFFVSMGTTVANAVAIAAAAEFGPRTLLDATAHQSLHFSCDLLGMSTTRIPVMPERPDVADLDAARALLAAARQREVPFHTLVLGSSTYGGLRLRAERIMLAVNEISPTTNIVFDDAWAGIHGFHDETSTMSPTWVAARLRGQGRFSGSIWVTHSAHKTMCAARQAAYVHVLGARRAVAATESSMYRHHTSSPAWPIMASLDLARAHAEQEGGECLDRALALHRELRARLIAGGFPASGRELPPRASAWYAPDELRFTLHLGDNAAAVRRRLIAEWGVYLPHSVGSELLANITIGIGADAIDALATGLLATMKDRPPAPRKDETRARRIMAEQTPQDYLIAYPPGVPIAYPETGARPVDGRRVEAELAGGASIHRVRRRVPAVDEHARGR
ncbi:hypothetical protein ACIBJI_24010 [Nocardia sp. NPDC050408]|uniref:hypothetical protein n=1 Tax=Nocardia sp. NPDC050408 TaxID=3364319 RepID=UPI0037B8D5C2